MSNQTRNPGIDYGLGDGTNRDPTTGISVGVINMNALHEWAWEDVEADYGDPACPECGGPAEDFDDVSDSLAEDDELEPYREGSCADYACTSCKLILDGEDVVGEDPVGYTLDADGYAGQVDPSDNDLALTKSPFYTRAQYCSPCAPGAGHLEYPCPTGPRTYCLDGSWFAGGVAPYPVYSVATGKLVPAPEKVKK